MITIKDNFIISYLIIVHYVHSIISYNCWLINN